MDPILKDAFQALAWLAAALGAGIAALKFVNDLRQTTLWNRTQLAKAIVDEIWAEPRCVSAMVMVDWNNREFTLQSGDIVRINRDDVRSALRTTGNMTFSPKEAFIRDCFDSLLDAFQRVQHYSNRGVARVRAPAEPQALINFDDIGYLFEYSVAELCAFRKEITAYISAYDMEKAASFLQRYPLWRNMDWHGREACVQEDAWPNSRWNGRAATDALRASPVFARRSPRR